MKKTVAYIVLLMSVGLACSDDDTIQKETLVTPSIHWSNSNLYNDMLMITVHIESNQNLPTGNLIFQTNGVVSGKFLPFKGEQKLLTAFTFDDNEIHQANLIYNFQDRRESTITSYALQKVQLEIGDNSIDSDWKDY